MNDITVLALLVSKAKASAFTMEYISQFEASDIDSDDVDLRFEVDGVETGTNVSIVDECGQAAQMIRTLVEALEAEQPHHNGMMQLSNELVMAKQRIAELESRTVTVNPYPLATDKSQGWTIHPDFLHQIGERISDDEENYDSRPSMEMVEAVLLAAGGINAEGQAGTVTVKLPKRYSCEGYHIDEAYLQEDPEGDCYDRDEVLEALAAAGIQVIEGEQKNG